MPSCIAALVKLATARCEREEFEQPDVLGQPILTTVTSASRLPNKPSQSDSAEDEALSVVVDTENAW